MLSPPYFFLPHLTFQEANESQQLSLGALIGKQRLLKGQSNIRPNPISPSPSFPSSSSSSSSMEEEEIFILLAVLRLPQVETDLCVVMNLPSSAHSSHPTLSHYLLHHIEEPLSEGVTSIHDLLTSSSFSSSSFIEGRESSSSFIQERKKEGEDDKEAHADNSFSFPAYDPIQAFSNIMHHLRIKDWSLFA